MYVSWEKTYFTLVVTCFGIVEDSIDVFFPVNTQIKLILIGELFPRYFQSSDLIGGMHQYTEALCPYS